MGLTILGRLVLVVVLLHSCRTSSLEEDSEEDSGSIKVRPRGYALNIQIFPDDEKFAGDVVVKAVILEATNVITINVHKNLTILASSVVLTKTIGAEQNEEIIVQKNEKVYDTGTFNIVMDKTLSAESECEIKIKFSGKLNTHNAEGLFKKSYVDSSTGQSKWIIGSKFKPNLTSLAFPCFDNPPFRAPFDVSIQRPSNVNSLSTMPLLRSVDMGTGWTKDIFVSTPPMAPFSLAIFVSDLTPVIYNKPDLQIRIWPAPELLQTIKQNRSDVIYKALNMFEEIFGVKYPLYKLDYIALPSSMDVNVATSWGLIISSQNNLGSNVEREKWAITSEMSNQWFGNLLTEYSMEDETMVSALSDSTHLFYSFMKLKKANEPLLDNWPLSDVYANYYEFGKPTASDNAEIRQMSISSKARFVYRMLTYILTPKTYSTALKNFVRDKQFKTFQIDDLWDAFTKQAHADGRLPTDMTVKDIVTPWLEYYRLPLVTVTRNYNANSAILTQRVFIRNRPHSLVKNQDILWNIPVVMTTQNKLDFTETKPKYWLKEKELNIKNVAGSNEFIIVNPDEIGTYMVNYDKTNWNMLANFLQSGDQRKKISVMTRAKLIHDALNLAYAGYLDFGTALNMTLFLKDETDYTVWRPFFIMFDHIGRYIDGSKAHKKYQTFVGILAKSLHDRIHANGYKQDKQTSALDREIEHSLRTIGNEPMLKEANIAYEKWMHNPNAGYAAAEKYLCTIFEYGTKEQWEFGLKTLSTLQDKPEIDRVYLFKTVVGCPVDSWKIKKFLNMTLFEQNGVFTDDDFNYATYMLTGGASGYMATFEFLNENWSILKDRLQNKPEIWKQLIYTATNLYKTQAGLDQISKFYAKHRGQFGKAETTIQNSLDKIKEEAQWTKENMGVLEDWLDNFILTNSPQN